MSSDGASSAALEHATPSPEYVLDRIELEDHAPEYVPEPEHPEYHVPSDDDIQVEDQPHADDASPTAESPGYIANSESMEEDSIDYLDEPEAGDEDHEEDPSEEHEPKDANHEENPNEEHKPEDEDTKEEEPSEGSDETEPFEKDETAVTPPPPPRHRRARISVRPQPPMAASTHALIDAFSVVLPLSPPLAPLIPSSLSQIPSPLFPLPTTSPTYDQAPLGHRTAMIRVRDDILEEDMLPWRRFVLTAPPPGPCHDARTIARAVDKAEDVRYVRALQASMHRTMTSIEEVNLRVSYQAQVRRRESDDFYTQLHDAYTDRRDIRLEIDVVKGQRTAYEIELHEVRQAYLSSEAQNKALLARLETLETHMSRMEWQH
ncbi:hypothetical protein Tco_1085100 [Tanacetum coccineum]